MMKIVKTITLQDLGYDGFFDSAYESARADGVFPARVIAEHKEVYRVKDAEGEYLARITGKHRFSARKREDYPAVGDWVTISKPDGENAVIRAVLPRKTLLRKKYSGKRDIQIIAANIDAAFVVESLDRDYSLNRFERYFVLAREGGIEPVAVLNKADLLSEAELEKAIEETRKRFPGIDVIATSILAERGIGALAGRMSKGKTYCFLGSSGVGKSSIINRLLEENTLKTGEVGEATGRGKHTTTAREMYFLPARENSGAGGEGGAIVIDNPGTREVGVADAEEGLENVFGEITRLSGECKYADCTHTHEPGCAVTRALGQGELDEGRYRNYLKLRKENEYYEMTDVEKREKDRKFGKFVKKILDGKRSEE